MEFDRESRVCYRMAQEADTPTLKQKVSHIKADRELLKRKLPADAFGWTNSGKHILALFLVSIFGLILPTGAQNQKPLFPVTQLSPLPGDGLYNNVSNVAVGDFNGDGLPDTVYTTANNQTSLSTVTVLLNSGAKTAPVPVVTSGIQCATTATQPVVADMNNDKNLDLLFACGTYIVVILGDGQGGFGAPAYSAVSGSVEQIAKPLDLNGDGYPDVAALIDTPANVPLVGVFLNKGSGGPGVLLSQFSYSLPVGTSGASITTGDFNGDGKQDVVASVDNPNGGATGFFALFGNGDGTLQAAQPAAAAAPAPFSGAAVAADFNHDGIDDIAYVTNPPATSFPPAVQAFQVLLGRSNGQFALGTNLPLPLFQSFGNIDSYIGLAFAGNTSAGTNLDLALISNSTTILLGDGNGGFTFGPTYAMSGPVNPETLTNGNTNLLFEVNSEFTSLSAGNGDGTFQAIPSFPSNPGLVLVDVNGDGLTDVLYVDNYGNLVTALSRGDGTFSQIDQTTPLSSPIDIVVAGDFNGDGKVDLIAIGPGTSTPSGNPIALYFCQGNGNGTFQACVAGPPLAPGVAYPTANIGDFNGDGKLDVMFGSSALPNKGVANELLFIPGNGDGTFGAPVTVSDQNNAGPLAIFPSDLNKDGKLDVIWNNDVFLSTGNGTFNQKPLGVTGTIEAVADLNGDGIPDVVATTAPPGYGVNGIALYAGVGDGTFQSAPFATIPLPSDGIDIVSVTSGDLNGDAFSDLVIETSNGSGILFANAYLGDGKGNFTADSNTYYAGTIPALTPTTSFLGRFNNQAPSLPNDQTLDYLTFSNNGATVLLNQVNSAPVKPTLFSTGTSLTVSATSAIIGQQLTFTANILGTQPTGSVTFSVASTTLGTAVVKGGVATLQASFATAGTYPVIATYVGDTQNAMSVSTSVAVTVIAPDFSIAASPTSATITDGQTASTTLTITPVGGYSGTINFTCGTLPTKASCTFSPASLKPSGTSTVTLTVSTTAPTTSMLRLSDKQLRTFALACLLGLMLSPKRIWKFNRIWTRGASLGGLLIFAVAAILSLSACGSSSKTTIPGTPKGPETISVTASDSTGDLSHSINFTITIQ